MKKHGVVFGALLLALILSTSSFGQKTGADYFQGKWSVLLKGIPGGDAKMIFILEKKDTTIVGVVQDSTGKEIAKLDKVEITPESATLYFTAQGYDVNLVMTKKDEDHVTGSLMSMFDAEGERLKQ